MQLFYRNQIKSIKAILKDYWGVDIDKDELVKYAPSKNGTQGFF